MSRTEASSVRGPVVLGERAALLVVALGAHLVVDLARDLAPVVTRARHALRGRAPGAVEGDPRHHLGVHEVPPRPAHLPDALVGLVPVLLQEAEQRPLQRPGVPVEADPGGPAEAERVDHLAVDVKLALADRRVADPDRRRVLVAGQPLRFPFGQPALAGHPVHDLDVLRVPGDRPLQPGPPRRRLLGVPGAQQRFEGDGGVAEPAVPVVPVAHPADVLGQRGGGRRHDPAGGGVGERLEGDQGPDHGVPVRPLVGAAGRPVAPEPGGQAQLGGGVGRLPGRPRGRAARSARTARARPRPPGSPRGGPCCGRPG